MSDSEPTHDNPRNTRNLPAVVPAGEIAREALRIAAGLDIYTNTEIVCEEL